MNQGLFAQAVAAYTRALQLNPSDLKACYYRALANEMVDRQAAIYDWRQFAELASTDSSSKEAVAEAQARARALRELPVLPDLLRSSRYMPEAGDYYQEVAQASVGLLWTEFPVKVFADSPPEGWRRALRGALDAWMGAFPLQAVSVRENADIVVSWAGLPKRTVGRERDSMRVEKEDGKVVSRRKKSFIILDNSHRWSEPEMRAAILHELGHALGIGGHSEGPRDVMSLGELKVFEESRGGGAATEILALSTQPGPSGVMSSTRINTKLTPRDVNTLIRLYNRPGLLVHLK